MSTDSVIYVINKRPLPLTQIKKMDAAQLSRVEFEIMQRLYRIGLRKEKRPKVLTNLLDEVMWQLRDKK
ncbi:MAG: hypothetical protein KGH71_02905 [Candidatus Micrarchaeota archaeon]|nr:hypothetical protein [Candidatus Micrarchaeota archaeon]